MAYADHSEGSTRVVSIIIVAILHAILGYAFVTGLAYQFVKKTAEQLNVVDVKEPPPPEEKPPPPPPDMPLPPPPVVSPPAVIQFDTPAAPVQSVPVAPPPPPPPTLAPPPPPPPPPPPKPIKPPTPRGDPAEWATNDDYPARALREDRAGTTSVRLSVGVDGRVTGCQVTGSSGTPELDSTTCALLSRRAKFNPATDDEGKPIAGTYPKSIRWVIPKE